MGDFYLKNKKYRDAIENYEKAIELSKKSKDLLRNKNPYKGIAEAYRLIGGEEKSVAYSQEFIKINDSIRMSNIKGIDTAVKKIVNEEKNIQEQSKSRLYWVIGGILLLAILLYFLAYWFYQNMKRKKENIISDSARRLAKKREIIEQKEKEAKELKLKVNKSFEEVVKLAKTNSPEFLMRFQEVYPDYYQKLINIEPKLLTTEVKLCAMIYLGFSTKDIAEYTFVTIKAAQHRKFRLRKKLKIPSDADIHTWINEV